jgi:primosomal protein N'
MTANNAPMGAQQAPGLQLNDIHLPEQINNFPMAIGWWLLAAFLLVSLVLFIRYYQNKRRLDFNKYKALKQLQDTPNISANETITLLKWAAMQYFNRAITANLYGDGFQQFLINNLPLQHQERFIALSTEAFKQQYQKVAVVNKNGDKNNTKNVNNESQIIIDKNCKAAAVLWLQKALPVKHTKNTAIIGEPAHD